MDNPDTWIAKFTALDRLDPLNRRNLVATSRVRRLAAGTRIFGVGETPRHYLLLIAGCVRVQQVADNGREIVLYRVTAGESCALTTACLLGDEIYQAEAIVETDSVAVGIARTSFDELIASSAAFRRFVFGAFSTRIVDLLRVIEDLAFSRLDLRLAQKLLNLGAASGHIALTHQQLAAELGTAREVISRQLQEFQRRGWIATTRGAVEIVDRPALARLAAPADPLLGD